MSIYKVLDRNIVQENIVKKNDQNQFDTEIVPRGTIYNIENVIKKLYTQVIHSKFLVLPGFFVLFLLLSTAWSQYKFLALFRSIKLLEFYLLFLYVYHKLFHVEQFYEKTKQNIENLNKNCSTWNNSYLERKCVFRRNFFVIIFISGFIQAILGIWQFFLQKSIGFLWLKESMLSPEAYGVAKIIFSEKIIMRSYGMFPHPNLLGFFLVFSFLMFFVFMKLFHVEQFHKNKEIIHSMFMVYFLAIMLTFSKTAILSLFIVALGLYLIKKCSLLLLNEKCSTWNILKEYCMFRKKMFHVEHFYKWFSQIRKKYILIFIIIVYLIFILLKSNLDSVLFRSISDRLFFINVSRGTIVNNFFSGVGAGQYVLSLLGETYLLKWQYQPVHNVFLLIWSEIGIFGLIIWFYFLFLLIKPLWFINVMKCSTWNIFKSKKKRLIYNEYIIYAKILSIVLLVVMLFDHYFWTIQQGQIMLWISLAVLAGIIRMKGTVEEQNISIDK